MTIKGVQRRVAVATDKNASQGRPYGLYGNAFSRASPEAIKMATQLLTPPPLVNILAMEAPAGGRGVYLRRTILDVLISCFTGVLSMSYNFSTFPLIDLLARLSRSPS